MLKTIRRAFMTATAFLLASTFVLAQSPQTVQGKVSDPSGEPVIGASVFVKDTQNGAITDVNGAYSLSRVKTGDILVFSCIGYTSQEIAWMGGH
ncbi:MAG: carboxypeptidase-like regulatory domain-containing protein [Bacteroidales bacterium]|nr:carboxypeptidase-like regulatory domain-containing protein [Bacteroidales bacterium]